MRVLITGANGFIGRNLLIRLQERSDIETVCYPSKQKLVRLDKFISNVDLVFHLAGVNRATNRNEFLDGNKEFTDQLCEAVSNEVKVSGKRIAVIYASSSQASLGNDYGESKRKAELALIEAGQNPLIAVHLFRLPNVFGKWAKPNYNSVVATFCHNIARELPIQINDPHAALKLVYIDDVIDKFIKIMDDGATSRADFDGFESLEPVYEATVGDLARQIQGFRDSRNSLITERVGSGFLRALYATYISYLPPDAFVYNLPQYTDNRGVFVEMLKTPDCGQFSFFTANPGVTRGGHYHHSKTEKFLIIKGLALFRFRSIQTGDEYQLHTSGLKPQVVETVPGWTHDVTNVGEEELVAMLWSNEVFDRGRPDTYDSPL